GFLSHRVNFYTRLRARAIYHCFATRRSCDLFHGSACHILATFDVRLPAHDVIAGVEAWAAGGIWRPAEWALASIPRCELPSPFSAGALSSTPPPFPANEGYPDGPSPGTDYPHAPFAARDRSLVRSIARRLP